MYGFPVINTSQLGQQYVNRDPKTGSCPPGYEPLKGKKYCVKKTEPPITAFVTPIFGPSFRPPFYKPPKTPIQKGPKPSGMTPAERQPVATTGCPDDQVMVFGRCMSKYAAAAFGGLVSPTGVSPTGVSPVGFSPGTAATLSGMPVSGNRSTRRSTFSMSPWES